MEYGRNDLFEFVLYSDPDSAPIETEEFIAMKAEEIRRSEDPADALRRVLGQFFHGREWAPWHVLAAREKRGGGSDPACPHDEWIALDGYANVLTIREDELDAYLEAAIDHDEFAEWLHTQKGEEEEEEE